jgi:hypothetical protein
MIRIVAIAVNMIAAGWWFLGTLWMVWRGVSVLHQGALLWFLWILPPALALIALLRAQPPRVDK